MFSLIYHWNLFPRDQSKSNKALVKIMAWRWIYDNHYLNQRIRIEYGQIITSIIVCGMEFVIHALTSTQNYNDVIMTTVASQITSLTVVYSIVYSGAEQRKHQSSASLAFLRGIQRDRWIPRTKGQQRGKWSIRWRHNGLTKLPLRLRHGWVLTSHYLCGCDYLSTP